jgi:signal transduction histidine kinase
MSAGDRHAMAPSSAVRRRTYAFLLVFLCLGRNARPALAEPAPIVRPPELPYRLTAGWEAADDGISWRPVDPMTEAGPFGGVRLYRIRVDLTACRGIALALSVPSLRDADETELDGTRIGGLGGFPPAVDPANLQARLYPLPTDITNTAGTHTFTLRIYHGRRPSSVFRAPPSLERLTYTAARAGLEQVLAVLAGTGFSLAAVFTVLFFGQQRREPIFLDFAAFALLLVVYLMSAHSAWSRWAVPRATPFRVAAVSASLLWLAYFDAARRLLAVPLPVRFRAYVGAFVAYAAFSAVTPDVSLLAIPTRLVRLLLIVCLLDLLPPTLRAIREGRAGARGILVGYVVFVWGVQVVEASALSASSFYALVGIVLVLLAVGVYTVGLKQSEARAAAVIEERSRIARDIHDTIAQGLVGVSMQLEAADAALLKNPPAASGALGRARRIVHACLEEARRSIWDLRRIVPGPDLGTALRQTAERLTEGTPVRAKLEIMGHPRALDGLVENHLLHIGEEAVSNVVRHARASQVRIAVAFTTDTVELSVEDDGCGFAPDSDGTAADGQFGILGMRERTQQMRGELVIETGRQQGTRVAVVVPIS